MKQEKINIGFKEMDKAIGGLAIPELTLIASSPNYYRTSFIYNVAINVAKSNNSVIIFSLDKKKEQVINEIINIECAISSNYSDTIKNLKLLEQNIYIYDSIDDVVNILFTTTELKKQENIKLIIIDYLQLLQFPVDIDEDQRLLRLKLLAEELNSHIIVTAKIPKEVESRKDNKPKIQDFKDYNISKYAHNIIFQYRDDYYNKDSDKKYVAELILEKNKMNNLGTVELMDIRGKYVNIDKIDDNK